MNNRKIILRADGGPSIGMGHFTRTLALAEMLNEHFRCIFATRQPSDYQIAEIAKVCYSRIDLPDNDSHFDIFLQHLTGDEIVVLDNYYFTTEYQKAIKAKGCKLVCIDDLHARHFVADVIINHSPAAKKSDYSCESYSKLFLGLRYALIRRPFREQVAIAACSRPINTAFVCFGGSDPYDLTLQTIKFLNSKRVKSINVVIGAAYRNFKTLRDYCSSNKNIVLNQSLSSVEMVNVMKDSDFAVVPSSSVILELFAIGLPVITGYFVENQREASEEIVNKGLAYGAGNMLENFAEKLSILFDKLCEPDKVSVMVQMQKSVFTDIETEFFQIFRSL